MKNINELQLKLQNKDNEYRQKLDIKEKELKKLILEINQLKSGRNQNNEILSIQPGEKVMVINFQSDDQTIFNYALPCKNTDLFVRIEEILIQDYPFLKDKHYNFLNKTNIIKRFRTIDENNIKNKDTINILEYSF